MKKNFLKIFMFFMIIFLTPKVFALDYDVSNVITSPVAPSGSGTYTGEEQNGSTSSWNINTRYQGTLQRIRFNIPLPSNWQDGECYSTNNTYTITMNMATSDWRNRFGTVRVVPYSSYSSNWSNGRVTFVSMKKIYFTFTIPSSYTTCVQSVYIDLPSSATFTPFTGETNWNLKSVILTDPMYTSGGDSGSGSGSTNNNQDIINGANKNTQDIINNQSENTNNIIDNSNQNTQDIINNQQELLGNCYKNFSNVNTLSIPYVSGNSGILTLEPISNNHKRFYFSFSSNYNLSRILIMPYNSSGTLITTNPWTSSVDLIYNSYYGGYYYDGGTNTSLNITFNNTVSYFVVGFVSLNNPTHVYSNIMISNSNMPFIEAGTTNCSSKIDETNQTINDSTNSIINNQNSNLNKQIESEQVCKSYSFTNVIQRDKFLDNAGRIQSGLNAGITDYIDIHSSTITKIKSSGVTWIYSCFYTDSKSLISCISSNNLNSNDQVPSNAYYVRFTMHSNDTPNWKICTNGNQAMNDTLTDSNVDSGVGTDFFSDFQDNSHGLTSIITAPLTAIGSITSSTCQPLSIPIPFTNGSVSLPCMTQVYQDNIPTIYNIWKVVSFGIIAYFICVDIFHIVKGFKDPESDKVEVLDL